MTLRIQDFGFDVVFTRGADNASDFLSRHPLRETDHEQETHAENYVNFLTTHAVSNSMTLAEIKEATKKDSTLQQLAKIIREHSWDSETKSSENHEQNIDEVSKYIQLRDELTTNDEADIILRGPHIIMSSLLRHRAISIAHEGHQGLVKTKQLIREKIWFPGIDKDVKERIEACLAC